MRNKIKLFALLSAFIFGQILVAESTFRILSTTNVHGEIEPCG
jgi:hypothetical protein